MSKSNDKKKPPQRAIIIEDDFTAGDVIADFLIDEGYAVKVFETTEEAEKEVKPDDILIVDVRIGSEQSAGVDFVISLKKNRNEFKKTKIIFTSNFGKRREIEDLLKQLDSSLTV